jgi:non-specific serine/threonine protein kinase
MLSHYRIVSKLGAGGMGEVWLAQDTRLDRKVALKLLPAEFTRDAERVRRFTQEAKAASALNHPNIISVYDIGECETGRFIVMELVAGRTLRSVIAADNSIETLFTLGRQMARALSAAHAAGITHRDIKPDNIMVRDDGYVKMLDFGLARLLPTTASDPEAATLAQQTTPGTVMGTLAYMSPEQASGQTASPPSDVFALGIVLYELATRRHPFKSETMIGYLHAITSQSPPSLTSVKSELPAELDDLILRMLEKEAINRPSAAEVAQALQEIERHGTSKAFSVRSAKDQVSKTSTPTNSGATREGEGFWVAVLPFKYPGANADLEALAEGLSEDIVTGLSRFSYLRVIARSSTFRFTSESADVRSAGKELGARYVMEGSLRQAGSSLRVSVQLVDAGTGAHLWAETYDRQFRSEEIFALQDDLVPRIVSTVADINGVLPRSMSEAVWSRSPDELSPYEAVLRSFRYFDRITPEELTSGRSCLELAVEKAPTYGDAWAMLALLCVQDYAQGFNLQSDSLKQGTTAAQRAVEAAPSNHLAYFSLAQAHFFQKELQSFRNAAERAVALNPMDGNSLAFVGELLTYVGDSERGLALASRAKQFNPNHPGWFWYADYFDAYRQGDYRRALSLILKANLPNHWGMHAGIAAAAGQLGELEAASKAVRDLLKLQPGFCATVNNTLAKWFDPEFREHLLDGLRKAGLEIAGEEEGSPHVSSETRAVEGFRVAVLPFKVRDADPDVSVLAEGLSEEISTGLSRFRYLSVVTSTSAVRVKGETEDERGLGAKLGTRYVLEGSISKGGSAIRVSAQLVDTQTGARLWSETYNRDLQSSSIFVLHDDVAGRIVATVADSYGVLVHSMRAAMRQKDDADLTPVEWQFQYFAYREQITPSAHAALKSRLERVAEQDERQSDLWACLAQIYVDEYAFGFQDDASSLDRALAAGRRGVELDRSNQFALVALAQVHFFRQNLAAFGPAAERAMALNPINTDALGILGLQIVHTGEFERGTAIVRRAMELNPNHAGWMHFAPLWDHFHKREYEQALECANRVDVPGLFWPYLVMASACGHLGRRAEAEAAVRDLLALDPEFAAHARSNVGSWHFASGLMDPILEGLRKAGLDIP